MSNRQTYRVTVVTSRLHAIDIPAQDEADAIARAKTLWHTGQTQRFDCVHHNRQEQFGIDEEASLHLADAANEDRAQWAEKALNTYARETGFIRPGDALAGLLCDLGHYADNLKLDYREELRCAAKAWAGEKEEDTAKSAT